MNPKVVHLDVTCWRGVSIGAEHYYGKLIGYRPQFSTVELERPLTSKEAKRLSKKDDFQYRAGHISGRFDTKDEVIQYAIKVFKNEFPDAVVLLLGDSGRLEPQRILAGPETLKVKANKIVDVYDKFEWVNRYGFFYRKPEDEPKIEKLTRQYMTLLKDCLK